MAMINIFFIYRERDEGKKDNIQSKNKLCEFYLKM